MHRRPRGQGRNAGGGGGPGVGAVARMLPAQTALRLAEAADGAQAAARGALHGVPMLAKDLGAAARGS